MNCILLTPHWPHTATENAGAALASATASERITDFMIETGVSGTGFSSDVELLVL